MSASSCLPVGSEIQKAGACWGSSDDCLSKTKAFLLKVTSPAQVFQAMAHSDVTVWEARSYARLPFPAGVKTNCLKSERIS